MSGRPEAPGPRVLVLVPARGGSKGIPRKNLQPVDGVSLVGRAVLGARRFLRERPLPGARIVVDTDDATIADEARRWGAEVPFLRPPELARDDTTTLASTLHLVDRLASDGWMPEVVVLLQPTSPLRRWQEIVACWDLHDESGVPVITVVGAGKPPQLAMTLGEGGVLRWLGPAPPPNVRRQDLAPAVAPSGSVYVTPVRTLRDEGAFVVAGLTLGVTCPAASSVDVDAPADLAAARRAAVLAAPDVPACVVEAPAAEVREGEEVALPGTDGTEVRHRVVRADALAGAPDRDVLLLPAQGAPGPNAWRLLAPGRVALWCGSEAEALADPFAPGAADVVVVPQGARALAARLEGLLRATAALRA